MGLLDFFSGSAPEKHEKKADDFVIRRSYGHAKLEYEKALDKINRLPIPKSDYRLFIEDKLQRCKETLAREHRQNGESLVEARCHDDARELFNLALELTKDPHLAADLEKLLESTPPAGQTEAEPFFHEAEPDRHLAEGDDPGSEEEYFTALCNSLEDAEQDEYNSYPDSFRQGFIALNRGDFTTAVTLLAEARNAYPFGTNHITLELATAHLNLGHNEEARKLLEDYLKEHPESLKAYYLMCDIFWESKAFDAATQLLAGCPKGLLESLPVRMLAGETLLRAERYEEAVSFFQELLNQGEWDSTVAQTLARAHEALGQHEKARALYAEIMGACTGCGTRVTPLVKLRFAETSLTCGDFSTKILEIYLGLVQEDPSSRLYYYQRISHIYKLQGNESESLRFAAFAKKLAEEGNQPG
jgi:predicted Zn-dependent protease